MPARQNHGFVADRHNLSIDTVQGDMADLRVFHDESFDVIVHPVSNVFVPDVCQAASKKRV